MTLKELQEKREADAKAATALQELAEKENRDMTPEEVGQFDGLIDGIEEAGRRIVRQSKVTDMATRGTGRLTTPSEPIDPISDRPREPARVRKYQPLTYLRNAKTITESNARQDAAYKAGMWLRGCRGDLRARRWCSERGLGFEEIESRAHTEGTLTTGGFFVPDEIDNLIIDLKETRGVFRQYARMSPMISDKKVRMRRQSGLTAYWVSEGATTTESTAAWNRVSLVAKDMGCLAIISNDLNEDSTISIGDALIGEMAYAFADQEDLSGFSGDGTSTYGGIIGVQNALLNLSTTIADIAGLFVGTGNAYSELTLTDFENVVALLPQYADTPNARWFMHRSFYYSTFMRVALASGGVTKEEIVNGQRTPMALGYPVVFSQVMPKVEANSQVCCVLGDLSLAADFGDRRQTSIMLSEHGTVGSVNLFETNQIGIRAVQRMDINVHDVGNQSATAGLRVPGPVVGLITAAS